MSQARRFASVSAGRIAYLERGEGPAALFVHGVFFHAEYWNGVIDLVAASRRCIAPDLLCHGQTQETGDADVSVAGQAEALIQLLDALAIDEVDLVANDTGGAIAQILAARHPERIRSLALTNCDTHDGWPPPAFAPTVELARRGGMPDALRRLAAEPAIARGAFAAGFERPETLTDRAVETFLEPLVASPERAAQLERFFRALDCAQTVAVEPLLRALHAPTLIVWGSADTFFELKWAHWLRDTIPGTRRLVELPGAKLFFPFERPERLAAELLVHWHGDALRERLVGRAA